MALDPRAEPTHSEPDHPAVTLRALIVGVLGVIVVGIGFPYADLIVQGTRPANTALPFGAIFVFFLLVALINPLPALLRRRALLSRPELLVVFIMLLVASAVPTWGLVGQVLPIMTGAQYYATPSNRWQQTVVEHLPDWAVPKDQAVVEGFYEGLAPGEPVPWGPWIGPLLAWVVLIAGLYAFTLGVTLLFHSQWNDHEKLVYPLMRLPIEMVNGVGGNRVVPTIMSNKLMWIGFLFAFLITSYVGVRHYWHSIPALNLRTNIDIPLQNETVPIRLWFNPSVSAFTYMIHADLAFSLWFFSLFTQIENPLMRMWGIGLGTQEIYGAGTPAISNQTMGAMIVLVLYGCYTARHRIKAVFKAALAGTPSPDGDADAASPQVTVALLIFGFLLMVGWMHVAGLSIVASVVFVFAMFVTFVALTRATIQGGVPVSRAALIPQSFTTTMLGSRFIGPHGLATLAMTFAFAADIRVFMMPFTAHANKLWAEIHGHKRGFVWMFVISVVICGLLGTWFTIRAGYNEGAVWLSSWLFTGCPQAAARFADEHIQNPQGPGYSKMGFLAVGGAVMWGLTVLHYQIPRWPLHPLGFAIGPTQPVVDLWFSIFLGWLAKWLVLRLGGYRSFRVGVAVLLGVILGQFVASGMWGIIDGITQTTDNMIYVY